MKTLSKSQKEKLKDQFTVREILGETHWLRYNFFAPKAKEGQQYPLVIYLHGAGERGSETRDALFNSGPVELACKEWQAKHPCFIAAPQCPEEQAWNLPQYQPLIAAMAESLPDEFPIDRNRIYITGISMGGFGTWAAICNYPALFAGAMPVCGGGVPETAKNGKFVPVWAFHAADDPVVSHGGKCYLEDSLGYLYGTRTMVSAFRAAGGSARYTEYPVGYMKKKYDLDAHASWTAAYSDKEALEWLFAQSREDRYVWELLQPGLWRIADCRDDYFYLLEGAERALVIDTGRGGGDFTGMLSALTRLPLELAVTHAHGDHMRHSDRFDTFYMSKKDLPLMALMQKTMIPCNESSAEQVENLHAGDKLDLGGLEIEAWPVAGHTAGSMVFIDRKHKAIFVGDALGAWLQVELALPVSRYKKSLKAFLKKIREEGLADYTFLSGHKWQETDGTSYFECNCTRLEDMIALCDLVLEKKEEAKPSTRSFKEPSFVAEYETAKMIFTESVRK